VHLPEALKKVGTHYVRVKLHPDVEPLVKVEITALEATPEQEEAETKSAREAVEEAAAARETAEESEED
jgi:hypothetical protein